jgi:serine phosphatase RsbU (regulator of sigma subunit)
MQMRKIWLLLGFFWLWGFALSAQPSKNDSTDKQIQSLLAQLKTTSGKEKVDVLELLTESYANSQPVKARNYAQQALDLARELDYEKGEANALKSIGSIYQLQSNYSQALEYFLNALRIYEKLKDEAGTANTLNNIGIVYQSQRKYDKARQYYERVLVIDQKTNDRKGQASTLNNLGDIYFQQNQHSQALAYYEQSLAIRQKLRDEAGIAVSIKNIGLVYYDQNDYALALLNFFKSLEIDNRLGNNANVATTYNNIANTYIKTERLDSALFYALKSYESTNSIGLDREKADACFTLAEVYSLQNDFEKAYQYQTEYLTIQDFVFNDDNTKKIEALQNSYEFEKQQAEANLANQRARNLQLIIYAGSIGFLLLLLLAYVLYRANQQKKKANALLTQQNFEINQQKEEITAQRDLIEEQFKEIEQKNIEITEKNINIESSIRYALTIQQAILPKQKVIDDILPLNFIFYRPRDVVSGDFYWFYYMQDEQDKSKSGKAIISAIDCTGHGVPGAFMSMIGDSLMNQIVIDRKVSSAHLILNELHKGILTALQQRETKNRDGMDMALCVIDFDSKTIEFAGAKNPLIYIQNHELKEIKAGMFSIGGWDEEEPEPETLFSSQTISYAESPITFYIYSDGFQDQFGGPKGKKFMRSSLKNLFLEIHKEPMTYQNQILGKTFDEWKGELYQVDDVLVIGVKVG